MGVSLNIATAAAVLSLAASSVFAGGIIRDLNVGTAGHSAAVLGPGLRTYSTIGGTFPTQNLSLNNPTKLGVFPAQALSTPFINYSVSNFELYTDVEANPTIQGYNAFKSTFSNGTTLVPQARYMGWYVGVAGGARNLLVTSGPGITESYSGNSSVVRLTNFGTGLYSFDATITTTVKEVGVGQAIVLSVLQLDRRFKSYLSFETAIRTADETATNVQVGVGVDLDPGSITQSIGGGSPSVDQSGTVMSTDITGGVRRITYTAADGTFGEHIASGVSSFASGAFSTSQGQGLNSILASTGNLNSAVTGSGDQMSGFLWERSLGAVPTPSSVQTTFFTTAFSINTAALLPEPSSLGLLLPAGMALARRRRS